MPFNSMAGKPLTTETIALNEKKMDMTLDDIIKMSKNTSTKTKKQRRQPNKSQKTLHNTSKVRALKMGQCMDSRSILRQGLLAQRRSNFQGNWFPLAAGAARRTAVAPVYVRSFNGSRAAHLHKPRIGAPPIQRRAVNGAFATKPQQQQVPREHQGNVASKQRPQTLDLLFANMKEQRMRVLSQKTNSGQRNGAGWQRMAQGRVGRLEGN